MVNKIKYWWIRNWYYNFDRDKVVRLHFKADKLFELGHIIRTTENPSRLKNIGKKYYLILKR